MPDAAVVRHKPRYSSSSLVRQWEMTIRLLKINMRRVITHRMAFDVPAVAFLPNYRLIKISQRRVTRDVALLFIYLVDTYAHMRVREMYVSADLVNILRKYLRMLRRRIKIDFQTFQRHFIEFVGKLCEKIAHIVSLITEHMFHIVIKECQITYVIHCSNSKTILRQFSLSYNQKSTNFRN